MPSLAAGGRRGIASLVAGLALALGVASVALADAHLESSTPADGAAITEVPAEIVMTFSERLTTDSSSVLRDASGATGGTGVVSAEDSHVMTIAVPTGLLPGEYEVRWTALSVDGHVTRGAFSFTFEPPATPEPTPPPTPTPAPSATTAPPEPTPTTAPTAAPSPTPDPEAAGDASALDVALPLIVAVVVVAALASLLVRGRRRPPEPGPS